MVRRKTCGHEKSKVLEISLSTKAPYHVERVTIICSRWIHRVIWYVCFSLSLHLSLSFALNLFSLFFSLSLHIYPIFYIVILHTLVCQSFVIPSKQHCPELTTPISYLLATRFFPSFQQLDTKPRHLYMFYILSINTTLREN